MVGDILQPTHLVFVLVVALLVLGPKRLPEVGRQLGNGLRDFRAAINGERNEPDEVEPPYEEPAPAEHEFAHEPATKATPAEHEFAHEPATNATPAEHEFAHEPATKATPGPHGHEFAHEPETSAGGDTQHGQQPDSGHEFAYETSESADKRTDPLA
jgi:sec-independent protein translocase protein TatA